MKGVPKRGVAAGKASGGRRSAEVVVAADATAAADQAESAPASPPSPPQRSAAIGPEVWPD